MRQQTQSMGDMPPPMNTNRQPPERKMRLDAFTFGEFTAGRSIGFTRILASGMPSVAEKNIPRSIGFTQWNGPPRGAQNRKAADVHEDRQ